jgi:hypothetical protein
VVHPGGDPDEVVVRGFLRRDVGTADDRDFLAGRAVEQLVSLVGYRVTLAPVREPDPLAVSLILVVRAPAAG